MRTLCPVRFGPLLAVLCSLVLPGFSLARAADSPLSGAPTVKRIGFDGLYKLGRWTPVEVEVTAVRPIDVQLQIEAPDPYGSSAVFPTEKVHLSPGTHRLTGHFQNGRLGSEIVVRLRAFVDGEPRTVPVAIAGLSTEPLTQTPILVATLGDPAGVSAQDSEAADAQETDPLLRAVPLGSADELPSEAVSYDSLDVLVIPGEYDIGPERSEALRQWVQGGGHLVVSTGADVAEYAQSPLAEWVPVSVAPEPQQLRDLGGLERFAGRNERLRVSREGVPAARIEEWQGRELVAGGPFGPLLVRVPYGFGRVSFLAVDLNRPPLADWPATDAVVRRIIGGTVPAGTTEGPTRTRQLTRSGITDVATQLRLTLENFPNIGRLSLWSIMGLLVAYLLVIGPLDYFLVHRVLKRPRMTWITFPLLVIAAGALAVRGAQTTNGEEIRFNQVDLIDIDAESELCRVRSWVNLYSPDTQRYQVDVGPAEWMQVSPGAVEEGAAQESPRVVWSGVPESSYGGMYRTGGFEVGRPEYEFAPNADAVSNLPVQIWSTRGLTAQWQGPAGARVRASLRSTGVGRLAGTLTHQFEAPLETWMLAYGSHVYLPELRRGEDIPAPLRPGEELRPEIRHRVAVRELEGFLTGTTATLVNPGDVRREEILVQQTEYDPLNPSYSPESRITQVVRMISFHQAAGGQEYTGLQNSMLRELDLSEHATDLNRAVLFGRLETPAARLELNGHDVEPERHFTFVRVVLPVTRETAPAEEADPREILDLRNQQPPDAAPLGPESP